MSQFNGRLLVGSLFGETQRRAHMRPHPGNAIGWHANSLDVEFETCHRFPFLADLFGVNKMCGMQRSTLYHGFAGCVKRQFR